MHTNTIVSKLPLPGTKYNENYTNRTPLRTMTHIVSAERKLIVNIGGASVTVFCRFGRFFVSVQIGARLP